MKPTIRIPRGTIQFRLSAQIPRKTGRGRLFSAFRRTARSLAVLSLTVLMAGCSVLQPEKLRQASIGATDRIAGANSFEASKTVLPVQMPNTMTIGKDGVVKLEFQPSSSATVRSTSEQNATAYGNSAAIDQRAFTAGQKMILWGIGLLVIVVALVIAWKYVSKTAIGAGISAGDSALSQLISHINSKTAGSTDLRITSEMQDLKATAENLRGKLNNTNGK